MGERDECNRTELCLERDRRRVENRPGGAHPGAEQGAMGGSLMLGMVPGMFDRLRLCQSADGKEAKHQEDREIFERAVVHRKRPIILFPYVIGGLPGLSRRRLDGESLKKVEGSG